jgi:ribosomal protein L11 methyltransferase
MREIRVRLEKNDPVAAALVRAQFERLGVAPQDLVEMERGSRRSVSLFVRSPAQAESLRKKLRSLGIRGIRLSVVALKDSDWKTRWKKYFKPFNITPEVRVVPAWVRHVPVNRSGRDIIIDTSVAFGTGLHATTRMMAGYIRFCRGCFRSFLDIGTGSGILALVAAQYGAHEISVIDNDPLATRTAEANFRANACEVFSQTVDFAAWKSQHPFDFVAANLLSADLIHVRARCARVVRRGGYLAVSGIFEDNMREFRKKFYGRPFRVVKEERRAKWYGVLFQRVPCARAHALR